jgi:hypothetical protein
MLLPPPLVLPLTRTIYLVQLTEFLQEMDGLQSQSVNRDKGVVIVGATNRVSLHLSQMISIQFANRPFLFCPASPSIWMQLSSADLGHAC